MTHLVLLPGLDGTGEFFGPLLGQLDAGLAPHIVRYPDDPTLDYAGYARLVGEQLPKNSPYVLVAESFSGPVAIQVAATHPHGLKGLVLCATFAKNPLPIPASFGWLSHLAPIHGAPMGLVARALLNEDTSATWAQSIGNVIRQSSEATLRARIRAAMQVDVRQQLSHVGVPICYLRATRDWIVSKRAFDTLRAFARTVDLIEIDGPHFLLQARPAECALAIKNFVDKIERRP